MSDNCADYVMSGLFFVKDKNGRFVLVKDLEERKQMLRDRITNLERGTVISISLDVVGDGLIRVEDPFMGLSRCYIGGLAFGWISACGNYSFDVIVDIEGCTCSEEEWLSDPNAAWRRYNREKWGVAEGL